jgi:hypothetical protein
MKSLKTLLIPISIIGLTWLPGNLPNMTDISHRNESTSERPAQSPITFESLLMEMTDRNRQARYPASEYSSLQSSSYNRESVDPGKPGWFADSDGVCWIREEYNKKRKEYVIMEHDGPGCLTRMWTPYFYYGFDNMTGPVVRIYLDGQKKPVIEENFIALLTGKSFIKAPFANFTARAGTCFLPIPYAKSCKITMDDKAFYNIINYRAYPEDQPVRSFTMKQYEQAIALLDKTAGILI